MSPTENESASASEPSKGSKDPGRPRRWSATKTTLVVAGVAAAAAAGVTALLVNIFEHKQEAKNPFFRVVQITDDTQDAAVWGKNFPLQYDSYKKTVDQKRTRYGGSEAVPRTPTQADPRSVVAQSKLEEDPRLKVMWAGYAFSKDFREERGHAYMLIDQHFTERQQAVKQPGTCINCHASTYIAMKRLGGGDLKAGFDKLNKMPYFDAAKEATHPVSCIDCHDASTMALRVTRPAFMAGIAAAKKLDGVANYDVNKDATRQEMRSYVCGQCHVEYYFKGPEKTLTYPWDKGLRADQILAYYEESGFKDWQHKETGAPALKAQHPEFELFNQGIHAKSGVACADCHMPYQRVGAFKVSDHHVRSPLLNLSAACQTCHRVPEEDLKARVDTIQSRFFEVRNLSMDALMELIDAIKAARAAGATDQQLEAALKLQRKSQFLLDFVEAENSTGFHADQEAMRVLGLSLNYSRLGALSIAEIYKSRATGAPLDQTRFLQGPGAAPAAPTLDGGAPAAPATDSGLPPTSLDAGPPSGTTSAR